MHTATTSTPGLLLSLSAALPGASPLRRQAAHVARQLNRPHPRALDRKASDLLARLLDATDCADAAGYSTDGVIDAAFDD
jgi:hypothetical protein